MYVEVAWQSASPKGVVLLIYKHLTERIIGAAIEVHRSLGPGLLESAYEQCLRRELDLCELSYQRQVDLRGRRGFTRDLRELPSQLKAILADQ